MEPRSFCMCVNVNKYVYIYRYTGPFNSHSNPIWASIYTATSSTQTHTHTQTATHSLQCSLPPYHTSSIVHITVNTHNHSTICPSPYIKNADYAAGVAHVDSTATIVSNPSHSILLAQDYILDYSIMNSRNMWAHLKMAWPRTAMASNNLVSWFLLFHSGCFVCVRHGAGAICNGSGRWMPCMWEWPRSGTGHGALCWTE